jgi:hypothetical protein
MAEKSDSPIKVTPAAGQPTRVAPAKPRVKVISTTSRAVAPSAGYLGGILLVLLLCAALSAYALFLWKNTNTTYVRVIANGIGLGLVAWLFFYLVTGRNWGSLARLLALGVLLVCSLASHVLRSQMDKYRISTAVASVASDIVAARPAASASDANIAPMPRISAVPKTSGTAGDIERVLRLTSNRLSAIDSDYKSDLDRSGCRRLLIPSRLASDSNMAESREILERTRAIIEKCKARNVKLLSDMRGGIEALKVSDTSKKEMLQNFDDAITEVKPKIEEAWDMEMQVVAEAEGIIELLGQKQGSWNCLTGVIAFSDANDARVFDQHMLTMHAITQKEEALQKERSKSLQEAAERSRQ